eukprot:5195907-Prorocentrum_lima.AAC.1
MCIRDRGKGSGRRRQFQSLPPARWQLATRMADERAKQLAAQASGQQSKQRASLSNAQAWERMASELVRSAALVEAGEAADTDQPAVAP